MYIRLEGHCRLWVLWCCDTSVWQYLVLYLVLSFLIIFWSGCFCFSLSGPSPAPCFGICPTASFRFVMFFIFDFCWMSFCAGLAQWSKIYLFPASGSRVSWAIPQHATLAVAQWRDRKEIRTRSRNILQPSSTKQEFPSPQEYNKPISHQVRAFLTLRSYRFWVPQFLHSGLSIRWFGGCSLYWTYNINTLRNWIRIDIRGLK